MALLESTRHGPDLGGSPERTIVDDECGLVRSSAADVLEFHRRLYRPTSLKNMGFRSERLSCSPTQPLRGGRSATADREWLKTVDYQKAPRIEMVELEEVDWEGRLERVYKAAKPIERLAGLDRASVDGLQGNA